MSLESYNEEFNAARGLAKTNPPNRNAPGRR